MKTTKYIILSLSILFSMTLQAQEKIEFSLDDLIRGGKTFAKYNPNMPSEVQWYGDKLVYTKGDSILLVPNKKGEKPQVLISKSDLNDKLSKNGKEQISRLSGLSFIYPDKPIILISNKNEQHIYNIDNQQIVASYKLPKEIKNSDFAAESQFMAYTKDNNLYVLTADGNELVVTTESDKGIVSGQSVHRNEFGIKKGTFWSPKGNLLAFYKMDETMVSDYPLVDISTRIAKLKDIKYPMAGMKSHQVSVGVYNPIKQETVFIKTGTPKEKYLTNIAWSPDEKSIYIAELNRGQDSCYLKRYSTETGKLEATLFEEIHTKYVEPENPVLFLPNNPKEFIWQSKRDGYNHLYLYNTEGKLLKQITKGSWDVLSIIGFDQKSENIYIVSTENSPIEKHIYQLNLKSGKTIKLSKEEGVHSALLSGSGNYICDTYSSQHNAGKIAIIDTKTKDSFVFHEAKNPFDSKPFPEINLGSLKANDGKTDLYYRIVKPINFDESKKYPVIVYVYGGPHSQLVDNSWLAQTKGWDIYMAQKGYIVFTLDNRGTANRGLDFENATHRRLGIVETEDQMTGVDYLKSLPYVDADRIGVHGWSYGGFMTLNLMLRHPETFKVGVAGGPVTDWKYYEVMYGERYMDSPEANPEGYEEASMVNKADKLQGRLMLIHGDEDPTVVMQHSLQFLKSSIKSGTHPDFFVYPGHGHNMLGTDRIHLHEHITRYFDDFLK